MKHAIPATLVASLLVAGVAAYVTQPDVVSVAAAPVRPPAKQRLGPVAPSNLAVDPVLRHPVLDGGNDQTIVGGDYYDRSRDCLRLYTVAGKWSCMADQDDVAAELAAARTALESELAQVADGGTHLAQRVAEVETAVAAAAPPCTAITITGLGLQVSIVSGETPVMTVPLEGARPAKGCMVTLPFKPVPGLFPRCFVPVDDQVSVYFEKTGLLSVYTVPAGPFHVCAVVSP